MPRYGDWLTDRQLIDAYRRVIGMLRRGQSRDLTQKQQLDVRTAIAEAQSFTGHASTDIETLIAALGGMLTELIDKKAAKEEGFIKE